MFGFFKKPVIFRLCLPVKITLFSRKLFYSVQAINLTLNVQCTCKSTVRNFFKYSNTVKKI